MSVEEKQYTSRVGSYVLIGLVQRSADQTRQLLAVALQNEVSRLTNNPDVVYHMDFLDREPWKEDVVIKDRVKGARYTTLEFDSDRKHFYVRDSSRDVLAREAVCKILDGLESLVQRF